mmetsp:Transcript_12930/g.28332  ORF Transcript_12930/g.28332 Transcript_12930/m.28332 type:complete len:298 (-) Transcript_12930:372-1265(-)
MNREFTSIKDFMQNGLSSTSTATNHRRSRTTNNLSASFCHASSLGSPTLHNTTPHSSDTRYTASASEGWSIRLAEVKPTEEIDVTEYSNEDFDNLKKKDPFMYYSIPEIRRSSFLMSEVDANESEDNDVVVENEETIAMAVNAINAGAIDIGTNIIGSINPQVSQSSSSRGQGKQPVFRNGQLRRQSSAHLRTTSCPAGMLANADISHSQRNAILNSRRRSGEQRRNGGLNNSLVVRKSVRLSVEAHPDLILREFEDDEDVFGVLERNNEGDGAEYEGGGDLDERFRRLVANFRSGE